MTVNYLEVLGLIFSTLGAHDFRLSLCIGVMSTFSFAYAWYSDILVEDHL